MTGDLRSLKFLSLNSIAPDVNVQGTNELSVNFHL